MWKNPYVKNSILIGFLFVTSIYTLSGQCDNPSLWPDTAVNIVCGGNTISSTIFAGEYSVTTGYQDQSTLVFSSSVAGDYITLRRAGDNAVITSGVSPLMILYVAGDGDIEIHINTDAACGTSATTRASYVHMTCGCNNGVLFPTGNVPITEGMNIITATQWAGDYNVTTGYIDGSACTFSSSVSTDYITLRQANTNTIITTGLSPVSITYDVSWGDVEMHINTNDTCGIENINRTTTVSMYNPYKGGNDDGFVSGCFAQPDNPILAIFKGGNDDGFVSSCFAQPDNLILAIFKGGNDDGFVSSCFAQPDNPILDIFKGGNDDGFISSWFAQPDNPILDIFKGGNDDGFVSSFFAQPDNPILAIFKGGIDDGFVVSCYEQCSGNNLKWLGYTSADWHTAANWECGILPTMTSDVMIPNGVPFSPTVSSNDMIHSLRFNPGASIIIVPPAELRLKSF